MNSSNLPPPLPLPLTHLIMMFVSCASIILYLLIVFLVLKHRKEHPALRSAFYGLLLNQAFADLCMFLVIELMLRPRKYRMLPVYTPQANTLFARFSYFALATTRTAMFLGYLPFALNRFTVFFEPILYKKIWKPKTTLFCAFIQWFLPITMNINLFFVFEGSVSFVLLPSGILQMLADETTGYVNNLQGIVTGVTVAVLCTALYAWTLMYAHQNNISQHTAKNEIPLLICSTVTFIPMILEAVRNVVQLVGFYVFDSLATYVTCTEIFFFTSEIASITQPWTILATNKLIRQLFCGEKEQEVIIVFSTMTIVNTPAVLKPSQVPILNLPCRRVNQIRDNK